MPMPRRGTRSPSSLATRRVTSDRSFGSSTSFAKCRRSVETVGHPRCRMPLRRTQTTPNDKLPASAVHPRSATKAHSGLCAFNAEVVPCLPHRGLKFHFCETNPIVARLPPRPSESPAEMELSEPRGSEAKLSPSSICPRMFPVALARSLAARKRQLVEEPKRIFSSSQLLVRCVLGAPHITPAFEQQPAAARRASPGSRIFYGGSGQRGQKLARIDRLTAMAQLEMQLRLADVTGRTDPRYDLPSRHFLPALHKQLIAVGVGRDPAVGMLNQNEIAVTAQLVSGIGDDAGIGRLDWRPPRRADIDAVVVRAVARGTIGG